MRTRTGRRAYLKGLLDDLIVSNFAATEFASGIARLVRMSELDADRVPEAFDSFDHWTRPIHGAR